jgi:bacterioferritin
MSPHKGLVAIASVPRGKRVAATARPALGLQDGSAARGSDHQALVRFLNRALATEIVCALRYRRHHFMARSLGSKRIAEEFLLHADEDLSQADLIAERITQLGGEPDFAPGTLQERSHLEYVAVGSVAEMVRENLAAKQLTINNYRGLIEYLGEEDPTTRRLLEGLLGVEQAHAAELLELLQDE